MKCNHCSIEFHPEGKVATLIKDKDGWWDANFFLCPACKKVNIFLLKYKYDEIREQKEYKDSDVFLVYPRNTSRPPCPIEVQNPFREDYIEACLVLNDSPKASAALSRRCLQSLLRTYVKVKHSTLNDEINEAISTSQIPTYLADLFHGLRSIGNLAAHPFENAVTGEVLPVTKEEAELTLSIIEGLFDFLIVRPEKEKKILAEVNKKLIAAGKKPI